MNYSLEVNDASQIQNKYPVLASISKSIFLNESSAESRIESSFVILSILSYSIAKRKDIL